jgi:protein-tyrosine phosphatase
MIDIHCHILPGLDDGARDMEEAVAMCRLAEADGVRTVVATPHCLNGIYQNNAQTILQVLDQLKVRINNEGISLSISPGADIHLHPEIIPFLKDNPQLLLGGRYFLLELPAQSVPREILDFIFKAQLAGYFPIITHPERNTVIQEKTAVLEEWVDSGVLVQVTAMSLTGAFGEQVAGCAWELVRSGLAQVVASDAHSPRRRPPQLSKVKKAIEEKFGLERAEIVLEENPGKILAGQPVEKAEPIEIGPQPSPFNWRRLFKGPFRKQT